MNMEAGIDPADYLDEDERRSRRMRRLIIGGIIALVVVVVAYLMFHNKAAPPAGGDTAPSVTVIIPGRHTVTTEIPAVGNIGARRDMPVGVAGEGGIVRAVLVEPGARVGAGQVLATVDRSVQVQQANALAASIAQARRTM